MAKIKLFRPRTSTKEVRKKIQFYYLEKFFNKWMNKYDFPQLNYQQKHYIMKKWWSQGSVACFPIKTADKELAGLIADGTIDMKENQLIFTPWAFGGLYNIYDFPTHARPINVRGVKFIPNKLMELDTEIVIGYAQKNHKSVYSSIEAKISEIVDIEMKKRLARKSQSQPFIVTFAPEDYDQAKLLQEQLENDEPYMFCPVNEADKVKGFSSGSPYIVDKLEQDRQKVENDILTMLGVNNVGIGEKKEHLIVDEVNANNEDIEQQSYSFTDEIRDFFNRVNVAFGYKVDVIDLNDQFKETEDKIDEDEEEDKYVANY